MVQFLILFKLSLDRTEQDLKFSLWGKPLEVTPRTIEPIFQNLRQIIYDF